MTSIKLVPVTKSNWLKCVKLNVKEDQKPFIASNLFSIAEYQFFDHMRMRAIYYGKEMIGFAMYGLDEDEGGLWIYRFMIDENYQDRGLGRESFQCVMDDVKDWARRLNKQHVTISYAPENDRGKAFYQQLGFETTGDVIEGEEVARYPLFRN
ncbi:GNAT family N-acetyltransferase [Pontibacillus yanchengensis]|uniref:Spermidine acetyltransferase n=1 Tax=Pontibacillus yanchengensis Y32 TaxID=1385514 RepID=A0A0A2T950_9BACI|nr:GNAT family N-acetyltransferase [Pontibacillus yanchengensis]KGP72089.1 spermidine acetyltransferase [Pontibacillus yanchengensis Y32]